MKNSTSCKVKRITPIECGYVAGCFCLVQLWLFFCCVGSRSSYH
jgi:hypothetical protein